MIRYIKDEKWKNFIKDFKRNPEKWYKDQIENDWEFDEETQLKIIEECFYDKNYEYSIKFIKNPKEQVCLKAIKQDRLALKYIKNPTEKICWEAIKQDGRVIKYIENPTEEMCLFAVKKKWDINSIY